MSSDVPQFSSSPTSWCAEELRGFLSLITYGFTNPMPDADDGPWKLTAKDIVGGRINYSTARKTTQEAFDSTLTDKSRPKVGDVLLTKDGSIGRVAVVDRPGVCINQSVALLRPNKRISSEYLKYLLLSPYYQSVMEGDSDGSTIKHIYITRVDKMQVAVPSLPEQEVIVGLVGALDDRITLLRETNATLEAIAQALFKSWFVDFDPVRAKMEGRVPEGMDEATAALFPDALVESELGLVPRGWQPVRLDAFIELAYGKALKAEHRKPGVVPVYGSGGVTGWHDTALVNQASVVVGRKGTVGSLYWESRPFFPIDTVFYVKSKRPLTYCHQLLKTLGLHDMNTDAAVPGLNRENVYRLLVPDVPADILEAFNELVNSLRGRIDQNEAQGRTLATVRDTLLPRLISGQLQLPEAQAEAEIAL